MCNINAKSKVFSIYVSNHQIINLGSASFFFSKEGTSLFFSKSTNNLRLCVFIVLNTDL